MMKVLAERYSSAVESAVSIASLPRTAPISSTLDDKPVGWKFGEVPKREVRLAFAFLLIALGALSLEDQDTRQWTTFILTYIDLMFPSVAQTVQEVEWKTIPPAMITLLEGIATLDLDLSSIRHDRTKVRTGLTGATLTPDDQTLIAAFSSSFATLSTTLGLPAYTNNNRVLGLVYLLGSIEITAHLSLVVFLCGKRVNDVTRSAITEKRPKAIEEKYFPKKECVSLSGFLRLSNASHSILSTVWSLNSRLRSAVVREFATFNSLDASINAEVMYTTFKLLKYADMHVMIFCMELLDAHPKVFRLQAVRAEIALLVGEINAFKTLSAIERPYYRLMHGDRGEMFRRQNYPNLLGLAVAVLGRTKSTLLQFNHDAPAAIIREFDELEDELHDE
jgi:hypothetical protein